MIEALQLTSPTLRLPHRGVVRWVLLGGTVLALVWLVESTYYVVQPTEMAGVRRFGVITSPAPIGPGLHWKLPVDRVDRVQVSLTQFQAGDLRA